MGSNGEKPISQEDSLSKEHEKMINVILRFFLISTTRHSAKKATILILINKFLAIY